MSSNGALLQKSVYDTDNDGKVNAAQAADSVPWSGVTGRPDIVQADWECDDSSSLAYVRNRPSIPQPVQADWDEDDSSALSFIRNKPEHFDQVQADWDESDSSSPAYISNKPGIPVVNNYTITITQGGVSKGSFTLNQGSNGTIPLDAGGGGGEVSPITAVEAETLSPGEQATAMFSGGTLTLGIPAGSNGTDGSDGTDGTTPVIQGGVATTVEYGSSPAVSVDSNGNTYTFNFSIPAGSPGTPGTPGANGVTPVMSMAAATTLPAGSAATATMTSAGSVYTISLGIPRGSDGQGGGTGTVTWGGIQGTLADQTDLASALNSKQDAITQATANTLDPGSAATISIVGGVMTLGIPRGSNGQNGSTPILSMGNVATLDPGQAATATMTSAGGSYTISLGIPAGYDGDPGTPGDPGDPGADGVTPVLSMGSVTTLAPGSSATAAMTSAGSVYTISLGIPRGSDGQGGTPQTVTWGGIQGTLSSQTDLQSALDAKQAAIDNSHKLDYGLLSNTPTIPTVNDATVYVSMGGVAVDSFTLNQGTNKSLQLPGGHWGSIGGTMSSQVDLWGTLELKMDKTSSVTAISAVQTMPASPSAGVLYIVTES